MATLVDSSVVIAAERGAMDMAEFVRRFPHEGLALSAVGAAELSFMVYTGRGIRRSDFGVRRSLTVSSR